MEAQYKLDNDGQAVNQTELNTLGKVAGLSDDRVFAELFRMAPKGASVAKGILPYRHQTSAASPTIMPNGASGSVKVNPFRVFIGSRTAVGTDALENWRDVRSALSVATGDTSLSHTVALAANASGNARWDAIYASVAVDANSAPVTRKVKNPGDGVVTEETVSLFAQTTVTIGVVTGTTSATPDWPALSSDSGSTYYVLLGYVRVPTGFGGSSTVLNKDIADQCPVLLLVGSNCQVADSQYTPGGTQLTTALIHTWGSTGARPNIYLPPAMGGSESLIVAVNLATGHLSLASGDVVDSRDWRNRIVRWSAVVGGYSAGTNDFAWMDPSSLPSPGIFVGNESTADTLNSQLVVSGMGATTFAAGSAGGCVAYLDGSFLGVMADSSIIYLYCDVADSGKLKCHFSGTPNVTALFWLEFSAPFGNA